MDRFHAKYSATSGVRLALLKLEAQYFHFLLINVCVCMQTLALIQHWLLGSEDEFSAIEVLWWSGVDIYAVVYIHHVYGISKTG